MSDKPTYKELLQRVQELEKINSQFESSKKGLLEINETQNLLVKHSQTGIYIHVSGLLKFVNRRFAEMMGYAVEEIVGRQYWDFVHPEDREMVKDISLARARGKAAPTEYEFRHQSKDGKTVWVHNLPFIIQYQGQTANMGNLVDITERINTELDLHRIKNAIDQSFDAIGIATAEGQHFYQNDTFTQLFGYTLNEVAAMHPKKLYQDPNIASQVFKKIMEGDSWTGQITMVSKTGEQIPIELRANAIKNEHGKVIGLVGIHLDISEQLKLEAKVRQAQRIESVGKLAGGIAHDFNNILYPIIGFTEMSIKELRNDHPVQENLEDILRGAKRARDLVKQILRFSRQENSDRKPIQIQPIITESLKLLRAGIPANIIIDQDIHENDDCILANPTELHEIIVNLCTNAYHAMEDTGGILTVALNRQAPYSSLSLPDDDYLCLSVSDTGKGIPSDILPQIFDPYFSTKGPGKGSGLGLSVVHGIVKEYNGDIQIESTPDKGTTFKLYFPIASEKPIMENESGDFELKTGTERILFVDDEKSILKLGSRILGNLGYEVVVAENGILALERFKLEPEKFDLVISDMAMPVMLGTDVAQGMMKIRPDIPIIICTGFSDKIDKEKATALGIKAYINKPILNKDLANQVRYVLDHTGKDKLCIES